MEVYIEFEINEIMCIVDSFGSDEFLKVWKGLHYCLWMTDKPLIQVPCMQSTLILITVVISDKSL